MFIVIDTHDQSAHGIYPDLKQAMEKRDILNSRMRPAYQSFFFYELFDPDFTGV